MQSDFFVLIQKNTLQLHVHLLLQTLLQGQTKTPYSSLFQIERRDNHPHNTQLTDKTFKAPLTIEEGAFGDSKIEVGVTTYFISSKENPQDFELDHLWHPTDEGMSLFLLRKDRHNRNMFVTGYYAVDKNGYGYRFAEQKAKDTPLTHLYIEELLN